jgi:hypothetical protein
MGTFSRVSVVGDGNDVDILVRMIGGEVKHG